MAYSVSTLTDVERFLDRAEEWLLRSEAENNLILSIAYRFRQEPAAGAPRALFTVVERDGEVVGCAFRTPPRKLVMTRLPLEAVGPLVGEIAAPVEELPGVLGPEAEATAFAERWSRLRGLACVPGMRQRMYALDRVELPEPPPRGSFRLAVEEDTAWVDAWLRAMVREAGVGDGSESPATRLIRERHLALWEDPEPRSVAAIAGSTPNGCRIAYVYTPPEHRGRGYASACVGRLSQLALERGCTHCTLYTDLANPTSNHIYQRLGYRPVGDVVDLLFRPLG